MQTLRPNPNASYRSVPEALYKMIRFEGLLRPIKGVSVVFVSAGPAHALYYSCYERMKMILSGTTISYDQTHLSHGNVGIHLIIFNIFFHSFRNGRLFIHTFT